MTTTEEVRSWLGSWRGVTKDQTLDLTHREKFDLWLIEHDAEVRAQAAEPGTFSTGVARCGDSITVTPARPEQERGRVST